MKPWVWTVAALIPATTGFFRMKAGKHYPTDVITGYAAGAIIGIGVPLLHRKKESNISVVPFSGRYKGANLTVRF